LVGALVRASADVAASVKLTRSAAPLPTPLDAAGGPTACGVEPSAVAAWFCELVDAPWQPAM